MKAVLLRISTQEIIFDGEYPRIDLEPVTGLDADLQWLLKIYTSAPVYDSKLQILTQSWTKDLVNSQYIQTWVVRDKTEAELIEEKEIAAAIVDSELSTEQVKKLLRKTAITLTEEEQVEYTTLFPAWKPNIPVLLDERYQHEGLLYKVVQAHTTQLDWEPQLVPALFTRVAAPEEIPVWVQPTGAQDAYMIGDKVHYPTITDPVYESLIDNNTWSPDAYPAAWQLV